MAGSQVEPEERRERTPAEKQVGLRISHLETSSLRVLEKQRTEKGPQIKNEQEEEVQEAAEAARRG